MQRLHRHNFLTLIQKQQGFTLVELVIAIGLSSILASILGGTLLLASKSLPGESVLLRQNQLTIAGLFHDDLNQSIACLEASKEQVVLITHDQTGDGLPDRVTYAVSSKTSPAVARTLNQVQTHEVTTPFVWSFNHLIEKRVTSLPGETTWSEQINISNLSVPYSGANLLIARDQWHSIPLNTALPEDTLLWKPTQIGLALSPYSLIGTVTISLNRFHLGEETIETYEHAETIYSQSYYTGLLPEDATYDPNDYDSDASDSYVWTIETIASDTPLQPGEKIQLQIACPSSSLVTEAAVARVDLESPGAHWYSTDDGQTWVVTDSLTLIHQIHASIATSDPDLSLARPYLYSTHIYSTSTNDTHQLTALNSPEILEQYLSADLSQDPTSLDLNQDGQADWENNSAQAFDAENLTNGYWQINGTFKSQETIFNSPTTIEIHLLTQSSNGIELDLLFDQDSSTNQWANIKVNLSQQVDGQDLRIHSIDSSSESTCLTRTTFDDNQWIRLRATVLPDEKLIAFWANNTFLGTFAYKQEVTSSNTSGLTLSADGENNFASNVSIRVSEADIQ